MISLTLMAVERYLITRAKRKGIGLKIEMEVSGYVFFCVSGADLPLRFYMIGMSTSWLVAFLFSLPPLLGYGR